MILVFGSLNVDLVARVPVIPGPGRTVLAPSYEIHFGGKGANQAVAAARIAGPGKVRMAGRLGQDVFGDEALKNLTGNGIDTSRIVRVHEPTGCAFITVDPNGENAITVASGANNTACAADVSETLLNADTVLVLQMEVPYAESLHLACKVKSANGKVIWNLAPVPDQMIGATIRGLLDATDYLIVNEHEALDLAAALDAGVTDFEAACGWLARSGGLTCVVTAGAQGAIAVTADDTRFRAPAPSIQPVDTIGAGDTFVGAFASMIGEKSSLKKALEVGCEAAGLSCLKAGAQQGMPMRDALREVPPRGPTTVPPT
ncbi:MULTISPECIES: ribokinase [unclassified Bradyrhizobium]|uniref:ribokinase n=1 Tax=unclassified Bradyrhizobium TaxID=2631580 RepID=UPI001BA92BC9|nr:MULTISPECIES: ribokinase [unclassified Bradyrhizobium]MBR1227552.1 ribokinase [Bradyrhizobium sp. AUGA SZCCT0176]MBR1295715.1 ribokinase [Bradyrhizobium sp. AUGA SZCCT0042]